MRESQSVLERLNSGDGWSWLQTWRSVLFQQLVHQQFEERPGLDVDSRRMGALLVVLKQGETVGNSYED